MTDPTLPREPAGTQLPPDEASAYVRAVEEKQPANVAPAGTGLTPKAKGHGPTPVSKVVSSPWFAAAIVVLAVALPFINSDSYTLRIATDALIFVMLAVGLNVVVGYCGLLDLGYAAFFAIGAYTSGLLSTTFGWPILLTIPAVVVMAVIGGIVIGAPTLRLRSDYLAIVTLGFGEIIRITANHLDLT